jgi:hypothetical protein
MGYHAPISLYTSTNTHKYTSRSHIHEIFGPSSIRLKIYTCVEIALSRRDQVPFHGSGVCKEGLAKQHVSSSLILRTPKMG